MKQLISVIIAVAMLSGCASFHPTVPEDYAGPKATIKDSSTSHDSGKADIFYLSKIDGNKIEDSRMKTMAASYGQGNYLSVVILDNSVPAQEHVFTIVGRTEYAMPIRALAGTVFEVKGDVTFSPQPNEAYMIKGVLREAGSSVWIEKLSDGEIVEKIEVEGSAKLGLFEK